MKRKIVIPLVAILGITFAYVFINMKDTTQETVMRASPSFYLNANDLVHGFTTENSSTNSILAEDIIGVMGKIKEINTLNNKQTIFLANSDGGNSSVLCDMQQNQINQIQKLKVGDTIRVKGVFKGFLKDVILLNCVITNQNE